MRSRPKAISARPAPTTQTPGSTGTIDLVLAGALVVGGVLAASNAVSAIRDPAAVEDVDWTRGKTLLNAGAVVLLSLALVAVLYPLFA